MQVLILELIGRQRYHRQLFARIARDTTNAGKVLRARQHAFRLTRLNPCRHQRPHCSRITSHGARSHHRVFRQQVQIAHRREIPIHTHRAGLARRQSGGTAQRFDITQRDNRRHRWKPRGTKKLLPRAALERGRDKQPMFRLDLQLFGQRAHDILLATNEMKSANTQLQCSLDARTLIGETGSGCPMQHGHQQLREVADRAHWNARRRLMKGASLMRLACSARVYAPHAHQSPWARFHSVR